MASINFLYTRRIGFLLFCLLAGCTTPQTPQIQPLTAAFNEAEYAPYLKPGMGKIAGQTFLKTVGRTTLYERGDREISRRMGPKMSGPNSNGKSTRRSERTAT